MKTLLTILAIATASFLASCESTPQDNPDTMVRTESWDGTGPVGGPTSASGPGAIGGGSNSGGSGSGAMTGPGTAAGAASYSSGRGP
jgi:hypothetical protein